MNKTLVIGGSGFVGSRLISNLGPSQSYNFDIKKSPYFEKQTTICDITNPSDLKFSSDIKSIVLLAAEHRDDVDPPSRYYEVNVQGTKNVLDAMDKHSIKNLIFTSSVAIYGLNKISPNEFFEPDPFNHYGKSKLRAELLIKEWYAQDPLGKSVTIIRPTVIFGERNRGNVYNLINQIYCGKFVMIGKGKNKKSMAYVGNVVDFIADRLKKLEVGCHVFNYADSPDFTMNELISTVCKELNLSNAKLKVPFILGLLGGYFFDIIAKITRKKMSVSSVRVKKFCATTQFDSNKAHTLFDAPFTLDQGLAKTIEHDFKNSKSDNVLFYSE